MSKLFKKGKSLAALVAAGASTGSKQYTGIEPARPPDKTSPRGLAPTRPRRTLGPARTPLAPASRLK